MVFTKQLSIRTRGNTHILDITPEVQAAIQEAQTTHGIVTVFNVGSTAGITTIEYEPGLVNHDIDAALEKVAPQKGYYE